MNRTPRRLTCYIKRTQSNPETWEGFCVEVDIPAIGDTYEEVVGKMHQRLANYIDFIHERQPDDEQSLMFRPMPGRQAWKLKLKRASSSACLSQSAGPERSTSAQSGEYRPSWTRITPNCASMDQTHPCLLYTSPSPRDRQKSRMPSSA